eukprot:EG_transcript_18911
MSSPQFDDFLPLPNSIYTELELPTDLWSESWLESIDKSEPTLVGKACPVDLRLKDEMSFGAPFDGCSDHGSCSSNPGSVGYLSLPNSFNSAPELTMDSPYAAIAVPDIIQTMPPKDFFVSHKKQADPSIESKAKRNAKAAKVSGTHHDDHSVDHNKYKTRLCRNWKETGKCPYGDTCVYAHGAKEMRCREDNEAAVMSLTKLADHLSRQRTAARLPPAKQMPDRQPQPQMGIWPNSTPLSHAAYAPAAPRQTQVPMFGFGSPGLARGIFQ